MSERLEEIKEWFNNNEELHEFQIEWLIEQAEKVEQYERDKEFDESIMQDYEKALQEKEEEIQRLETELMMLR